MVHKNTFTHIQYIASDVCIFTYAHSKINKESQITTHQHTYSSTSSDIFHNRHNLPWCIQFVEKTNTKVR